MASEWWRNGGQIMVSFDRDLHCGTNSHVYNLNAVNHKFRLYIVHTSIFLWVTTFFKHLKILWLLLFAVPQMDIERIFRLKLNADIQNPIVVSLCSAAHVPEKLCYFHTILSMTMDE